MEPPQRSAEDVLMPYGGHDWLALTQEPTLEPELPICDPHHHFWDLRTERLPYQRYLLHELLADITTATTCGRPCSSRHAPCTARMARSSCGRSGRSSSSRGWPPPPPAGCTARPGRRGHRWPRQPEPGRAGRGQCSRRLQAASPNRFRGIRHSVTWDPHPEVGNRASRKARWPQPTSGRARGCWPRWGCRSTPG